MRTQTFYRAVEEAKKNDPIERRRSNIGICQACKEAGWHGVQVTYQDKDTKNWITCDGAELDYEGMEHASKHTVEIRAKHRAPHHVGNTEDVVRVSVDWDLNRDTDLAIPVRRVVFFPVDLAARHEHIPFITNAGIPNKSE